MQMKIFPSLTVSEVEQKINEWLGENHDEIIIVQFAQSTNKDGGLTVSFLYEKVVSAVKNFPGLSCGR